MTIKRIKWDIKKAKKLFADNNCKLLEEVYINNRTKMRYECSCRRESKITLHHFMEGKRCRGCMGEKLAEKFKFSHKEVKEIFRKEGCKLISKTYKNNDTKMKFQCDCGRFDEITLIGFRRGGRCKECGIEKRSGKNYYNYNFDKTDEERRIERSYPGYGQWRKKVYKRDNFTCVVSGKSISGNLVAHHLESYGSNRKLRTVVSNGVTMDVKCHKEFHKKYGYGNNTREQFEEFLKEYQKILIS